MIALVPAALLLPVLLAAPPTPSAASSASAGATSTATTEAPSTDAVPSSDDGAADEAPSSGRARGAVASTFGQDPVHAGSAEDAFRACCYAGFCTYVAINECSLLTPAGKVLSLMAAGVGGATGLIGGAMLGWGAYWVYAEALPSGTPLDSYKTQDTLLAMALLSGAAGIVIGGMTGMAAGIAVDWLILGPTREMRMRRSRYGSVDDEGSSGAPSRQVREEPLEF